MTTTKKNVGSQHTTKQENENSNFMLRGVRSGLGALESTTLTLAEVPLTVLTGLGVSSDTTDKAREGGRRVLHGVSGSIDTIATQTTGLAGKGVSLVTSVVGGSKS